jgi:hypothetical protein
MLKILLLILIIILINYIINKRNENMYKKKLNIIKNKNIEYIKNDENLVNILFSIQEYYNHNEQAYNEFIDNLNLFLQFYNFVEIDNSLAAHLYRNLLDQKKIILNSLISLSIKLPIEYNLQDSISDIEQILNEYLKKTHDIYEEYLKKNGLDYTTKLIILNDIEPYNENINILEPDKYLYFSRV